MLFTGTQVFLQTINRLKYRYYCVAKALTNKLFAAYICFGIFCVYITLIQTYCALSIKVAYENHLF